MNQSFIANNSYSNNPSQTSAYRYSLSKLFKKKDANSGRTTIAGPPGAYKGATQTTKFLSGFQLQNVTLIIDLSNLYSLPNCNRSRTRTQWTTPSFLEVEM